MNNYTNQDLVLERLKREWHQDGKLIIAVDFDNTIYDSNNEGLDLEGTISAVKTAHDLGHEIYCFTANGDYNFVLEHWVEVFCFVPAINESSLDNAIFGNRKPLYNLLLDDRAGLCTALRTLNQINFYVREQK